MSALAWPEARRYARDTARPLGPVPQPLPDALGCALAVPLVALAPLPAYHCAAMDGYAVAGPGPWQVTGRVLAGDPGLPAPLADGEAVEIGTGAVVPAGADAVLPYERATRTARTVHGESSPAGTYAAGVRTVRSASRCCRPVPSSTRSCSGWQPASDTTH